MWRLIYDILRFNACARRLARGPPSMFEDDYSIGEYLDSEGYSNSFRNNYLIVSMRVFVKGSSGLSCELIICDETK
jgi:hypothetical protein